ncbi:hypothetical protein CEXT_628911 [Caerostris extrusa]|uniref:Uncharacterized protein n=1 Tax=Caerostris extrusa TaxID=172846 RepID=A0AAV4NEK7_CAEEX|nr:hypothetical protein CEXT_628911 [Caerostris extrusa]
MQTTDKCDFSPAELHALRLTLDGWVNSNTRATRSLLIRPPLAFDTPECGVHVPDAGVEDRPPSGSTSATTNATRWGIVFARGKGRALLEIGLNTIACKAQNQTATQEVISQLKALLRADNDPSSNTNPSCEKLRLRIQRNLPFEARV